MANTRLNPEKITKPFQFMAAWFAMLVFLVSILLTAAINITQPQWAAGYLVIFTSVLIVLVLGCVTLMLTVFRPHLQEGREYAQWLKDRNIYSAGIFVREQSLVRSPALRRSKTLVGRDTGLKNFSVSVSNIPGSDRLISALAEAGFFAEIYHSTSSSDGLDALEAHEAIWVGCALSAKEAIQSIKIAVSQWPHLRYLHLSNDGGVPPEEVHRQMYFGGASSTAQGYGLSPWSNDELLRFNENLSQEEFHRVIRSKYS